MTSANRSSGSETAEQKKKRNKNKHPHFNSLTYSGGR